MLFDKLESRLVTITLVALPLLYLALRFGLLERIRRIRFKLFAACVAGQVVALVAAVIAAHSAPMPFDPPIDGLFAVLLVYASMLSLVLAYLLAGSMTAALGRIRAGAARIADGDLTTHIEVAAHDELADLAADLNAMAARLDAAARHERRMEQSRRELIAAVSHDLRTPLSAIRAMIEAITDGVVTDEETIRRYLRTMHDGTRELSHLIDDLFELSRIEAGALTLTLEPVVVGDLISDALERLRPQAEERSIALTGSADPTLPAVPLDAHHISRVLTNLIENALRHTPAGGQVQVQARRDRAGLYVEVVDSGEGIAAADLPHIFDRFYRGEKSRSRESGGAGLGLSISKGIVEAHGGTIRAETLQPHGTRISVTLPIAGAGERPDEPSPVFQGPVESVQGSRPIPAAGEQERHLLAD
jgi:signal transduction histidine kinase